MVRGKPLRASVEKTKDQPRNTAKGRFFVERRVGRKSPKKTEFQTLASETKERRTEV